MNTEGLKTIITKRFTDNLIDIKPDIFKINRSYNNKEFAAHYFDCSEKFLEENFDLDEYQRSLLAEDYYSNSGPLQWNYYLYFISEHLAPASKKNAIESDKAFSRKYVATPEELVRIVETQTRLREQPKEKLDDALVTVWKRRLKEAGLHGIYLSKEHPKINDVFQAFLDNKEYIEIEETDRNVMESEIMTSKIDQLTLKDFRSFKANNFRFKKVNLIRGVNGVGKTSLMEAIELCLCGQTIENASKKELATTLQITYSNGTIDRYSPEDNKKFQARDRAWYGNNTLRGNSLSQGFHKYNFFDSDAAFRFTLESNSGEAVKQIFSRVILGEQANVVFNRVERFSEKLTSELKNAQKLRQTYLDERLDLQAKLKEFESGSEIISALSDIISALDQRKWQGVDLFLTDNSNRTQFQIELAKVNKFLHEVTDGLLRTSVTFNSLQNDSVRIKDLIEKATSIQSSFDDYFAQITKLQSSRKLIDDQLRIVERAEKYFKFPEIIELKGVQGRLQSSRQFVSRTQHIVNSLKTYTNQADKTIGIALREHQEKLGSLRDQLNQIALDIVPIERTLGLLNKLRVDLTKNAEAYIRISNEQDHCPLCHSPFPERNILAIISSATSELKEAEIFREYSLKKSELESTIESCMKGIEELSAIKAFLSDQQNNDLNGLEQLSIGSLRNELENILNQKIEEGKRVRGLSDSFAQSDLNESEFDSINREFALTGVDLSLGKSTIVDFTNMRQSLKDQQATLHDRELALRKGRDETEQEIIQATAAYLKEPTTSYQKNIDNSLSKLMERGRKISEVIKLYNEISTLISVDQDENFAMLKHEFDSITEQFDTYLAIESKNRLKKEYVDRLQVLKLSIEDIDTRISRYANASAVLKDIIENNNRENYLKEFFIQNKWSILDVFKIIHTPNEFDDILFESSEAIKLKVKDKSELRDLSEISTGQKSALILSLFMSLNNNLVSGPPLILFDDPIAYVDDINTLSFLDFLRETVIAKDRQLFFATANNKLANLFQQKFSFLEDDFEIIRMGFPYP